jgi:hypothetical protein
MSADEHFNEIWLWASTATFAIKAVMFSILGWLIWNGHERVGLKPPPLGVRLMILFGSVTAVSLSLSFIFGLSLWSVLDGIGSPPPPPTAVPFWVRTIARVAVLASAWGVILAGVMVVRYVQAETLRRMEDTDDRTATAAERLADATERIADSADSVALLGDAGRSADATERIADTGERISPGGGDR